MATPYSPKRTFANVAAASTDSVLVAAVSTPAPHSLKVLAVALTCGGVATAVTFNSKPAGAGTAISATFSLGANGIEVLPRQELGWFVTNSGEGLTVTTGAGSTVGIQVIYAED